MAWVTPSTQVSGDIITASIWNQNVVNNTIALKAEADALPIGNITPVTASTVLGRGSAGGNGVAQGLTMGPGLTINGTALAWSSLTSDYNYIINSYFDVWQRGTSFNPLSPGAAYFADRWYANQGTGGGASIVASQQTHTAGEPLGAGLGEPKYFARVTFGSGAAPTLRQPVESARTLANRTVTVVVIVRAATNQTLSVNLTQHFGTGGSPSADVVTSTGGGSLSLTASFATYSWTLTLPSVSGKTFGTNGDDSLYVTFNPGGAGAGAYDFGAVGLFDGSVALAIPRRPYGTELELCYRYYQQLGGSAAQLSMLIAPGYCWSTTQGYVLIPLPIPMRIAPTITNPSTISNLAVRDVNGNRVALTVLTYGTGTTSSSAGGTFTVASGLVAGNGTVLGANNIATGFITFDAELY